MSETTTERPALHAVLQGPAVQQVILADAAGVQALREAGLFRGADVVDITNEDPTPGPGWRYERGRFIAPPQAGPEPTPDVHDGVPVVAPLTLEELRVRVEEQQAVIDELVNIVLFGGGEPA